MIAAVMGSKRAIRPDVLQIVAHLDPENEQDQIFQKLRKSACEELQKKFQAEPQGDDQSERPRAAAKEADKQGEEAAKEKMERLNGLTPPDLKHLLPGGGELLGSGMP